ncbi:MAG: TRAP transporter small permease [Amphritea sp.]
MLRILYMSGQWLSAIAMMLLVAMTITDVFLRWVFNSPIYGSSEIANLLLTITVGAGLLVTTSTRSHIKVDMLEHYLVRRFGNAYHTINKYFEALGAVAFAGFVGLYAYEALSFDEVTVVLEWPVAPVFFVAALSSSIAVIYLFKPIAGSSH